MDVSDRLAAAKGEKALSKAPVLRRVMLRSAVFGVLGSIIFVPALLDAFNELGSADPYGDPRVNTFRRVAIVGTVVSAAVFAWVLFRAVLVSRARAASDLAATQIRVAKLKTALTAMLIVSVISWIALAAVGNSVFGEDFPMVEMLPGLIGTVVVLIWLLDAKRAEAEVQLLAQNRSPDATEKTVAAKKARTAAKKRNMTPLYAGLAVIAIIGIGAILYARGQRTEMATDLVDMTQLAEGADLVDQAQGMPIGREGAPVQVIVFSDFMCPGCRHWVTAIEQQLKPEFIETGRVHYTYYDFPLMPGHRFSFLAARAARCAGDQGKFWEYHDVLFSRQEQWSYGAGMPTEQLLQYGTELGLDADQFESCVRSDTHAVVVSANKKLGETLGVSGTPTVYVNGRKLGEREWNTYEAVKAAVQAAGG